jgi:DUF4097 and DUF4098 domain-containing protein YvlB
MGEHRFHTPEPVELEINIPVGDIEVETADGDETVITVEGTEKLVEQTIVEQRGRTIVVELRGKKAFGITIAIGDFSFGNNRLKIRARIPHASDAQVETAAADVELRGRLGRVTTKSASGDLRVDGEIERELTVKTVSGDVRAARVGGELRVQSVSGDVRAESVGGSVEAKSVSGDLRVQSVREGRVNVTSVSGDIEIGVAPGTNLDVDAGSLSGDLTSEVPLGSEPGGDADGPTLVVRGKTVSGDFKVFRAA